MSIGFSPIPNELHDTMEVVGVLRSVLPFLEGDGCFGFGVETSAQVLHGRVPLRSLETRGLANRFYHASTQV